MRVLPLASAAWRFRDATCGSAWRAALVPGCVHRDLLRHRLIPDPFWGTNETDLQWIEERDWEYRTSFTAPKSLLAEAVVELVSEGLDTVATVWLNGRESPARTICFSAVAGRSIAPAPRENELLIRFGSAMEYIGRTAPGTTRATSTIRSDVARSSANNNASSAGTGARVSSPPASGATSAWKAGPVTGSTACG